MAIRPGITGNPAELLDGAKVDYIREYTAGNGVQNQGRTNGVAIETGKVGEYKEGSITNAVTVLASPTTVSSDITLSSGVWLISFMLPVDMTCGNVSGNVVQVAAFVAYGGSNTQVGLNRTLGGVRTFSALSEQSVQTLPYSTVWAFTGDDQTIRVRANKAYEVGTGAVSTVGSASSCGKFFAIRIA